MASQASKRSLFDAVIVRRAVVDALVKLKPHTMMKNPVMFVVELGSVLTTVLLVVNLLAHRRSAAPSRALPLRPADHAVALVHGLVCELCGGDGGRPRQGAGRCSAPGKI